MLDMPGFGEAPPLPAGVEPSAANLAAAIKARCDELGIERPHVAGNSLGAWVGLEMGRRRLGRLGHRALPRRPLAQPARPARPRPPRAGARRLRPLVSLALRLRAPREAMLRTFAAHPERIPVAAGRELVLGWIDASGYEGANRAMRTHLFDPAGYPEDVAGHDRLGRARPAGRPAEARAPPRRRALPDPARRRPHPDLGRPRAGRPHPARGEYGSGRPTMIIERTENPQWLSNAYLVADEEGGTGVLIDGNDDLGPLLERAERDGIEITHILVTHPHVDHVAGLAEAREKLGGRADGRPRRGRG